MSARPLLPKDHHDEQSIDRRIALVIQYLGTQFHGWQRQLNQRTVQAEIEDCLTALLQRHVVLHGAGRTDAGVHAAAQVAHFDAPSVVPPHRWASILTNRLPDDILVRASAQVPSDWHSRFSATYRRYRYTIYTDDRPNLFVRPLVWHYYHDLDVDRMQAALTPLIGRHHLAAFHRAGSKRAHSWVDVQAAECIRRGAFVQIELQASGFLYGMMRLLVGMLVEVGQGTRSPAEFTEIWSTERRDLVKYAAPPHGLCLLRVGYNDLPIDPALWFDAQPQFVLPTPPANLDKETYERHEQNLCTLTGDD